MVIIYIALGTLVLLVAVLWLAVCGLANRIDLASARAMAAQSMCEALRDAYIEHLEMIHKVGRS